MSNFAYSFQFKGIGIGVLASVCGALLASQAVFADNAMDAHLKGLKCSKEISSMLDQWDPKRDWHKQVPSADGAQVERTSTDEVGVWLETRIYPDKSVEALRITPHTTTMVSWKGDSCVPALSVQKKGYDPERMKHAFTDADLEQLVKTNEPGVVYAWSPGMPYSMEGMKYIEEATQKLHVKLTKVLDPHASPKEAARLAKKHHLKNCLKPLESIELFNRGIGNHYPGMIVYNKGHVLAPLVPGLKDESHYERFIQEQLAK